jgi:hypothetical protein
VTRPTTKHSHACVWGMEGAGPLLDWLGVQRRHRSCSTCPTTTRWSPGRRRWSTAWSRWPTCWSGCSTR